MTSPVVAEAVISFAVPVIDVTPEAEVDVEVLVFVIVIAPDELVTEIPEPAVRFAKAKPVPLPTNSWPFAGAVVTPVPPLAMPKVLVTSAVRLTLLEDSFPVASEWTTPAPRVEIVAEPEATKFPPIT